MDGLQLDIFDLLVPEVEITEDFNTMTDEQIAARLGELLGVPFKFDNWEYVAKVGRKKATKFTVHTSRYTTKYDDKAGKKFISAGAFTSTSGTGRPCDSLEEAYKFFKSEKERAET